MDYLFIALISILASGLTFFSGFGLGTILLPVFAIFFPLDLAISITAIVHLLNNLFKLLLTYRSINFPVALRFGLAAIPAAFLGAYVLGLLSGAESLFSYQFMEKQFEISPVKLVIALLILVFSLAEILPAFSGMQFHPRYLSLGGLLSGFFGGLSGNQGALRSAFLLKTSLNKEAFIATGVLIACLIDFSRLAVYSKHFPDFSDQRLLLMFLSAVIPAFLGAFLGQRLIKKMTLKSLQRLVSVCLILFSILLGMGLI